MISSALATMSGSQWCECRKDLAEKLSGENYQGRLLTSSQRQC